MSFRSKRSATVPKSIKSLRNLEGESLVNVIPAFEHTVEAACLAFECPQKIIVWKEPIGASLNIKLTDIKNKRHVSKLSHYISSEHKKGNVTDKTRETVSIASSIQHKEQPPKSDAGTVVLRCFQDLHNRLTEVHLVKVPHVPRILMQVLTLYVPMYKYLNKIVIKRCGIDVYTIHELNKLLACSSITDVCLDDSTLPEGNYAILLNVNANIKHLSLCRCKINDEICKQIATKLDQLATPTPKTVQFLDLTSNQITDEGAKYLGIALRSNRTLRYLNLSGNRLTDEGAAYIFNVLMGFPLTHEESIRRRQRHFRYLKERWNCLSQQIENLEKSETASLKSKKRSDSGTTKDTKRSDSVTPKDTKRSDSVTPKDTKRSDSVTPKDIKRKAESLVNELMGSFTDPYSTNHVEIRDGFTYCIGNTSLCYLNLAYNNLAFPSLTKLLTVLKYQNDITLIPEAGLLKVVLDGNYIPTNCEELFEINEYFAKKQLKRDPRKNKRMSGTRPRVATSSRIKFD